jgi:hypothetical protein
VWVSIAHRCTGSYVSSRNFPPTVWGGGFVGVDEFQIANCFLAQRERGRFLCGCPLRTVVPVPT